MAGQMILVGFSGKSAAETRQVADLLGRGVMGGVMYLRTNVSSLAAVKAMNAQFRGAGAPLPPLIALDQEGGKVQRLSAQVGFPDTPSAAKVAATQTPAQAQALYLRMAEGLKDLGFDLNFGPVVDLNINPDNPIIGAFGRSYGTDPSKVAAYASAFIQAHHAAGLLTALKHFPGHGSSRKDSHKGFVDITRTWQIRELDPFKILIDRREADMVMVAHLYHAKFDPDGEKLPASLSPSWITGVLRQHLGYDGVVITDDMEMGAIRKEFGFDEAIRRAVMAGADILLFSNTADARLSLAGEVRDVLVANAEKDPAFRARIVESYNRIKALKQRLD